MERHLAAVKNAVLILLKYVIRTIDNKILR
jgi:hypothetical protein